MRGVTVPRLVKMTPLPNRLPNGELPDSRRTTSSNDPEALRARVSELEALCAEVYVAAVELGLPRSLLNRLWTVAAHGSSPHAFDLDMPPRSPSPGAAGQQTASNAGPVKAMPLPDIRLTDRPGSRRPDSAAASRQPELVELPIRRTVLVVDDDPMMLEVLVRILQRENFEILTASSGAEALQKASQAAVPIDLLITDYAMPEMRGRELAERMRAQYPTVRVLYQTGFSDMLFENRSELEEGAAFLEKPFTARGLREAARIILFGAINP
jgi:CheY-like chemotaxis protein